jgi:transposase
MMRHRRLPRLSAARQTKNITLTAAAAHLGVWPTVISRLERGRQRNHTIATNYRQWRNAA